MKLNYVILDNEYLVLGGNDNDGEHPLNEQSIGRTHFIELYSSLLESNPLTVTQDPLTKEWVLSNRINGNIKKILFNADLLTLNLNKVDLNNPVEFFSGHSNSFIMKSGFPYLVDLKITEYCAFGCEFCYTSSTTGGEHASADFIIHNVIPELKKAQVFEVVLGGGEPTIHPEIARIAKQFQANGFKLGITTRNFNLHKHPNFIEILNSVNSIAFSINSIDDLNSVTAFFNKLNEFTTTNNHPLDDSVVNRPIFYMQTILGLHKWSDTFKLIKNATSENREYNQRFNNVTVLGLKNFGFGTNFTNKIDDTKWISDLKKLAKSHWNLNIGVDSIIASKYREELLGNKIEWNRLTGAEGKQSCYVDCVTKTVAPSSFTNDNIIKYNFDQNQFLEIFSKF